VRGARLLTDPRRLTSPLAGCRADAINPRRRAPHEPRQTVPSLLGAATRATKRPAGPSDQINSAEGPSLMSFQRVPAPRRTSARGNHGAPDRAA